MSGRPHADQGEAYYHHHHHQSTVPPPTSNTPAAPVVQRQHSPPTAGAPRDHRHYRQDDVGASSYNNCGPTSVRRRRVDQQHPTVVVRGGDNGESASPSSSLEPPPPPSRSRTNYRDPRQARKAQHKYSDDEEYYDAGNAADDEFADDTRHRLRGGNEPPASQQDIYFIVETALDAREQRQRRERELASAKGATTTFGKWTSTFAGLDDTESQSSSSDPPPLYSSSPATITSAAAKSIGPDIESQAELVANSKEIRTRFAHVLGRANGASRMGIALFFLFLAMIVYVYTLSVRVADLQALHSHELSQRSAVAANRHPDKSSLPASWFVNDGTGGGDHTQKRAAAPSDSDVMTRFFTQDNATWSSSSSKYRLGTFTFRTKDDIAKNYVRYPPTGYIKGLDRATLVHYELCCVAKSGDYICGTRHNYMYDIRMDSIVKSDEHGSFVVAMVESKQQHAVDECTLSFVSTLSSSSDSTRKK